jgi:hypothetical protein
MHKIHKATWAEETKHYLHFDSLEISGSGFCFDCDGEGHVDTSVFTPILLESWKVANDTSRFARRFQTITRRIKTPALWKCDCGQAMECEGFTNTCPKCGTDYNWGGQHLAPRSCWGEETGEYPSDIIALR